jgi:cytochrome P450
MPTAVEEFLRAYAPVTMARMVAEDYEFEGCPFKQGDWVLLPFPSANRDPEAFPDADRVVIDRAENRHSAFGPVSTVAWAPTWRASSCGSRSRSGSPTTRTSS